MDQNFRKHLQKTLYSGELESEHSPLALTELAVEYFHELAPHKLGYVDLQTASAITSQETVSPSSVTMSMIYAKRLQRKRPDYVKKMSSSDLFLISMLIEGFWMVVCFAQMMASKYLYDEGIDEEVFNDEWAENAGTDKEEVNIMEKDFLDALDWELFIKKEEFNQTLSSIEKSIAMKEGLKRGWFSYTDLCLLLNDPLMQSFVSKVGLEWLKVVMVSSAAYFAAVMTMVGSTVLVTNASLALITSDMLPVLSQLQTIPAVLSAGAPATLLPSSFLLEIPGVISNPSDSGFSVNETGDAQERKGKLMSETSDSPKIPGKSVVDTILSQLMAVLMLKAHLTQFVSSVSESFATAGHKSQLEKTDHPLNAGCCMDSNGKGQFEEEEENLFANIKFSWPMQKDESVGQIRGTGSCMYCGKKQLPKKSCEWRFGFLNSDVILPSSSGCDCWKVGLMQQRLADCHCWKEQIIENTQKAIVESQKQEHGYSTRMERHPNRHCLVEFRTYMQNLCSDMTIGCSTSMPPSLYVS